jgi:hypothetical protein
MKFWKTADICEVAVTKTLFRVCGGIGFGMEMRQRLNRKISIVRELRINPKKIEPLERCVEKYTQERISP